MSASVPADVAAALAGLRWDLTPEQISSEAARLIRVTTAVLDAVAAAVAAPSFASVVAPLVELDAAEEAATASVTFVKDVAVSPAVREASAAAQAALSAFEVKAQHRVDVYAALRAFAASPGAAAAATGEHARFVERALRDYKRRGLDLPAETRAVVEALKTRTAELCVAFQAAVGEVKDTLAFSDAELAGMPADFVAALALDAHGKRVVTLAYPHVVPVLQSCSVPATRAAVDRAFARRAIGANVARLEEVVRLRRHAAALLGYPSHAAFVLEDRMARDVPTVRSFLEALQRDLAPSHAADLARLAALKAATEGAGAGPITMADYRFYVERELVALHAVDHDVVQNYFPVESTVAGMLAVYEETFGLTFARVPGVPTWHADVTAYAVYDDAPAAPPAPGAWTAHAPARGELLGVFYLDLAPREGKYSHAAVFPLISGCDAPAVAGGAGEGAGQGAGAGAPRRRVPVAAMVANFSAPTADRPGLLKHSEVVTLFHEAGHVLHHLLSRTATARFASFKCEQDFVEAPSQMLESWAWDPATLKRVSRHWQTGAPLPDALAAALAASRSAHAGLLMTRQIFLASLDMALHTLPAVPPPPPGADAAGAGGAIDTAALLDELHATILGIARTPDTNFAASFAHLVGGYDAGYYGYAYSEVFAADMASPFRESSAGFVNGAIGAKYRAAILAPGGARDAMDSLVAFLGRAPTTAAFLRSKGLVPAGDAASASR